MRSVRVMRVVAVGLVIVRVMRVRAMSMRTVVVPPRWAVIVGAPAPQLPHFSRPFFAPFVPARGQQVGQRRSSSFRLLLL